MKILLCPDSFKGAVSAQNAARAMETGLRRVWPDSEIVHLPLADGGEGTLDALLSAAGSGGTRITQTVSGPLGTVVDAAWGLLDEGTTAVVELAQAAGLGLVPPDLRDPKTTTTTGVGQLLLSALQTPGVRRIIIGLGGSATNDGGAGLLAALGVRFLDGSGKDLPVGGAALLHLARIDETLLNFATALLQTEILLACDVTNPLLGENGASAVFGPQKGATPDEVALLNSALAHFAHTWNKPHDAPGMGAAGGCAWGILSLFPRARLRSGIDLVLDAVHFDNHLIGADLVITGEGQINAQTLSGKAVHGVARRTRTQSGGRVPVAALVGAIGDDISPAALLRAGIDAVMPLSCGPETLEAALKNTAMRLSDAAERAARWIQLGRQGGDLRRP